MYNINQFLATIRWQDIADITINSYILFRLYILFRGTKAFRMLIGVAFLWSFRYIAASLGLTVASWAIEGVTAFAFLVIIIVFNNEIRSVFQAKTLKTLLWGFPQKTVHTPVELIVDSVFEMAEKYCGALIVLPGKEDLKEAVKNSISWDGIISKEMITSIFWHNGPVHDGAVIIQGGRVAAVSAILPLSTRTDMPSYYGTRHRAAKGLTETTDAFVIIVSEERGNVTVAKKSQMTVMYSKKELEMQIIDHLGLGEKKPVERIKEKLSPALAALICILLISGIWFGITRGSKTLITIEVPIEYVNRDSRMEIINTSINTVRLHLSGSDVLIKSVRPENIRVKIDISKAEVGYNSFKIMNENITLPPGILLTKIEPQVVEMSIDAPITKDIPVQADWNGKLAGHLILESATISPERLHVIGSSRVLSKLSTIYTEKISLDKLEKTGKITIKPAIDKDGLEIAPNTPDKVTVEYTIRERGQTSSTPISPSLREN